MRKGKIRYRRTRHADLVPAMRLIISTINHLYRKTGRQPIKARITKPWPLMEHRLRTDPEGTFVAVNEKDKMIGFCLSLVREQEWYLAQLFVKPSYQTKGVGARLLEKAMHYGKCNNCNRWGLCTFSSNEQALALYSRSGMPPQRPILELRRTLNDKTTIRDLTPEINLRCREVTQERFINRLNQLDHKARKTRRPEEHFFWLGDSNSHTYTFYNERKLVGYSVANNSGHIGPVVASRPRYLTSLLAATINITRGNNITMQSLYLPGECGAILQSLLAVDFRIDQVFLEMASEKLADLSIYLPGNLAHY
ncbi:MAG: GNAT family N-acetyltransferase [candidate division Zixibacteria bacterium]|nr:GNAT family N-acetyltransferase [candidate division Zixibacteria bacterium]